jgi:hypothetical protein
VPLLTKMPTTPPIKPATELSAEAGTSARLADPAGAARVVAPPVATDPPPVGAVERAKTAGANRVVLDCEIAPVPREEATPLFPTTAVTSGVDPVPEAELRPVVGLVLLLAAANNEFGVTSAARRGSVAIVTCFVGAGAIGTCPVGGAVPPVARTPAATAAVMIVDLLAIVIAESFPLKGPSLE